MNMQYNRQRRSALNILATTRIWRSSYEPPLARLLWRLGANVPPPHFGSFVGTALSYGAFFGAGLGIVMWPYFWSVEGAPWTAVALLAVLAGGLFGLAMASYYAYGRRKYRLPSWASLAEHCSGA